MRIWIIDHYAISPNEVGITRHYDFAKELIHRGHDVTIISANFNHFSHSYTPFSSSNNQIDNRHEVPFVRIPTPSYHGNTIFRLFNMLVFSWRLLQKKYLPQNLLVPDIIIGSSPHLFAALSAQILAKKMKKTFILEIRDLWPDTLVDTKRFGYKHPLIIFMKWIELLLYKRAKRIICLLPHAYDYLIQCGVQIKNICYIPNAIATSFNLLENNMVNKRFTIIYAGSHGFANDLETVVSAAKILEDKGLASRIRICLIGDGPEKKRLIKLASLQSISLLEFLDAVPKKYIYSPLSEADAFLMLLKDLPIFYRGISPNKLYDYMAIGKPVIFAVNTHYNPILESNAGFTIPPGDAQSLADAIYKMSLLSNSELKLMGQRGRDYVVKHHNITHLTDKLEKMLNEVNVA